MRGMSVDLGQWGSVRAQFGQPAQNMRIAPQLFQAADLGVVSAQVTQKTAEGGVITSDGRSR